VVRRPRQPLVTALLALTVTAFDGLLLALALGGLRALLNHPRALALLVVWALAGITLALLHPVRSQDTVAEERDPAWRLALLFFLPLLIPPVAAWGERAGVLPLPPIEGLRWLGVGLAAFGLALRVSAMATLGTRFAPIPAVQREHPVEERGVYRRIRVRQQPRVAAADPVRRAAGGARAPRGGAARAPSRRFVPRLSRADRSVPAATGALIPAPFFAAPGPISLAVPR
jgi:hypothetical protein